MNEQTLLHTNKGLEAVELAKRLFFPESLDDANKWASQWTPSQKKKATLEIFSYIPRKHTYYSFKFHIGDSVLGGKLGTYKDILKKYSGLIPYLNEYVISD